MSLGFENNGDGRQVGGRLKALRATRGWSQADVAAQLHVTRQTVSGWECGRCEPDLACLQKLARVYGLTLDGLLYGVQAKARGRSVWRWLFLLFAAGLAANALVQMAVFYRGQWTDPDALSRAGALLDSVRHWDAPGWYLLVGFFPQVAGAFAFYAVFDAMQHANSTGKRRRYAVALSAVLAPVLALLFQLLWAQCTRGTATAFGGPLQYAMGSEFWLPFLVGLFCLCHAVKRAEGLQPAAARLG